MKNCVMAALVIVALVPMLAMGKGKTYDDLDDIIKHQAEGKIAARTTHKAYQEPKGEGKKIDPNIVVHKHIAVSEESQSILPTGYMMQPGYKKGGVPLVVQANKTTRVYTKYAS